jgi:hypothetical protein
MISMRHKMTPYSSVTAGCADIEKRSAKTLMDYEIQLDGERAQPAPIN